MQIEPLVVGPLQTNCYIAYDDSACIVVDPGYSAETIVKKLDGRKLDLIILTHGHMDHIGALPDLVNATGAAVAACEVEVPRILDPEMMSFDTSYYGYLPVKKVDMPLEDGEQFEVGEIALQAVHTPGHTEGSMCILMQDYSVLFSGDTLFCGTHGRTDFPGGNPHDMVNSLQKLMVLPDDVSVLPGHNNFTTIGQERPWIERQTQALR